ncbi:hypothetical protein ACVILL_003516 [Bradyrhizobium sp. USDA 3364]
MRMALWLIAACALTLATTARAERPDCGSFPDTRSRLTCYDNVSRAPSEPEAAAHPPVAQGNAMKMNDRSLHHGSHRRCYFHANTGCSRSATRVARPASTSRN